MKFDDDVLRELLTTFSEEAAEHLALLNQHVIALERGLVGQEREEIFVRLLRAAHTLKGASAAVDLRSAEALVHGLEDLFEALRRQSGGASTGAFDVIYGTLDAIAILVDEALTGAPATLDVDAIAAGIRSTTHAVSMPDTDVPSAGENHISDVPTPEGFATLVEQAERTSRVAVASSSTEDSVRVDIRKLDALLASVGELLSASITVDHHVAEAKSLTRRIAEWETASRKTPSGPVYRNQAELNEIHAGARRLLSDFAVDARRLARLTSALQDDVRSSRMLPASAVLGSFPRLVRDLARDGGKEVDLVITGEDTEIDRAVLQHVKDPLVHLLRNCVDHGLEPPDDRRLLGKPRRGTITIRVDQQGDSFLIEVGDDGTGIDSRSVRDQAVRRGLIARETAENLSDAEAFALVFRSGLSTRAAITGVSGRGIGLDVVRDAVERLNGLISVDSSPGAGTRFGLRLPLTIATTRCLLVKAGGQVFALPVGNVTRVGEVNPADVGTSAGREALALGDGLVPLTGLADLLGGPRDQLEPHGRRFAVTVGNSDRRHALVVGEILRIQELAVKSLPWPLIRVRHVAGMSILGTGEAVVVLNVAELMAAAESRDVLRLVQSPRPSQEQRTGGRILIADDSITTRSLEKNILEAAGYEVVAVADGLEAWIRISNEPFDAVVSDVTMPRMTGVELTARIRSEENLRGVPVILLTALNSLEDREQGMKAGADAYMVKNSFDQEQLLTTIRELI